MFLLPSLVLGLVFALVLGGRPSRLLSVELRGQSAVFAALALQGVLFSPLGAGLDESASGLLHVASYALLIVFAGLNVRVRALAPLLLGLLLNTVAIVANGGRMPLSPGAARAAGFDVGATSNVSAGATHLRFLGDVFALPAGLPLTNVFSVGDILIGFGMIAFVVVIASDDGGENPLRLSRILGPFRVPAYRRLAAGKLVSHTGDWLTLTALVGWIYSTTGSTGQVSALMLSRLAPPIIGGGVAALVVDRLPKQRLLVWIELARGLAVAGALAGVVGGRTGLVFAALACSGMLAAISNAAVPALLPGLLPPAQLAPANAGLGIAKDGAMALGAIGAGLALSWLNVADALAFDLATFVAAIFLFRGLGRGRLGALRPARPERATSGLRYVLASRWLLLLALSFAAATLATGLTNASLPRFLGSVGLGAGGYGFGIAALAAGLALGQALVGFTRVGETAGRWIGAGLLVMGALFVLLGLTHHAPTALLVIAAIGFVDGTTDVLYETVVQREADPRYYGAVFGFSSAFITTTMMGAVALAPLANRVLASRSVILGTSALLAAAGAIALLGMRRPRPAARPAPATV